MPGESQRVSRAAQLGEPSSQCLLVPYRPLALLAEIELCAKKDESVGRKQIILVKTAENPPAIAQKSINQTSGQGAARRHPLVLPQASSQPRWAAPAASAPTTHRMRLP